MIVEGDYKQIPILFTKIRLAPNLEFPEVRESSKAAAIGTGHMVLTLSSLNLLQVDADIFHCLVTFNPTKRKHVCWLRV